MPDEIVVATTPEQYAAFGELVREYIGWLQARYADVPGFIDRVTDHQALDSELIDLGTRYGPPAGRCLLAVRGGEVVGGVAYRDLHDGTCEMKRLYVPERYGGRGTGRRLCVELVTAATADGYRLMRLDTGFLNTEAMAMYASLGFRPSGPYLDYPAEVLPHLRFMERPLQGTGPAAAAPEGTVSPDPLP